MFIEQNKMKRQSQLLLQNSAPDQQLLKALDDNAKLTHTLEEERLQHQQKVKQDYFSSHGEVWKPCDFKEYHVFVIFRIIWYLVPHKSSQSKN